ncbi:hypothetical protein [Streptomyces minutiscleroticus]|uniref:hypothetical protein n=1 Tax=Streptomyces minutiscleroticus TaxID=68238 RepID=UPI00167EC8D1|nr:hypothetical protein [Streptomyces minutiscleroticus]
MVPRNRPCAGAGRWSGTATLQVTGADGPLPGTAALPPVPFGAGTARRHRSSSITSPAAPAAAYGP